MPTIVPKLEKHFRKVRLVKYDPSVDERFRSDDGFHTINIIEGEIETIARFEGLFVTIKISNLSIVCFIRDFEHKVGDCVTCIGHIHHDWSPDFRTPKKYPIAMKCIHIKWTETVCLPDPDHNLNLIKKACLFK